MTYGQQETEHNDRHRSPRPPTRRATRAARVPRTPLPRRGRARAAAGQHGPVPAAAAARAARWCSARARPAASMAQALEALWPADAPLSGLVVTRYDHMPPRPDGLAAAHRSRRGRASGARRGRPSARPQRILALTRGPDGRRPGAVPDLRRRLGAAHAAGRGLTLADKQRINKRAARISGANIGEMNCVRKHLSRIKGGRLAAACAPARVVTLTISDVPGDDPAVIASGPTVPDATTCADALAILERYGIEVPAAVRARLEQRRARNAQARRRGVRRPRGAPDRHAAAVARSRGRGGARGRHRGAHPERRDRRRVARGRQGACGAGARRGAARRSRSRGPA